MVNQLILKLKYLVDHFLEAEVPILKCHVIARPVQNFLNQIRHIFTDNKWLDWRSWGVKSSLPSYLSRFKVTVKLDSQIWNTYQGQGCKSWCIFVPKQGFWSSYWHLFKATVTIRATWTCRETVIGQLRLLAYISEWKTIYFCQHPPHSL